MKMVTVCLSLLITSFFIGQAKADSWGGELVHTREGFSESTKSESFKNAWFSTIPVFVSKDVNSTRFTLGSGVMIFKKVIGNFTYVGVLSAEHIINGFGPRSRLLPMRNTIYDIQSGEDKLSTQFEGFAVVSRTVSKKADLGFFLMRGPNKEALNIGTASFPRHCDLRKGESIALIGHPNITTRPRNSQNVPISEPTVMRKRISIGFFEGSTKVISTAPGVSYGTTADSLGGNSGGPAINSKGEVVGIVSGILSDNTNRYLGRENGRSLEPYSFIVDCQATKDFAQESWQYLLSKLPTEI